MKSAILPFLLYVLLAPALAGAADGAGEGAARRSLDLSLPREALTETWRPPSTGNATPLPELGSPRMGTSDTARRSGGHRGDLHRVDLPYGAGYEARRSGGSGGHGRGGGWGR